MNIANWEFRHPDIQALVIAVENSLARSNRTFYILYFVILTIFTAAIVEIAAAYVWSGILQGDRYVALYAERKASLEKIMVDPTSGAIGYEPGTTVTTYNTGEFVDRFAVWHSKDLGVGIFDDGIDADKPRKAIVIGDSFGRGVGATSLEKNWVETAERTAGDIDILNLSFVGAGIAGYTDNYDRFAGHFPHDLVVMSFDADSDFIDSAYSRNRLVLFRSADDLKKRALALSYDEGCERMNAAFYNIRTLLTVSEVLRRRYEWANVALRNFYPPCPSSAAPPPDILEERRKAVKASEDFASESHADMPEVMRSLLRDRDLQAEAREAHFRGYRISVQSYHRERALADIVADSAAAQINKFSKKLHGGG
ncbi:MAG: hypothetical protein RJQ21_04215 [Rhodospirillales bacterium]